MPTISGAPPRTDRLTAAAARIEELANSAISEDEFFERFLATLVEAAPAAAGVLWWLTQQGVLSKLCGAGLDRLPLESNALAVRMNAKIVLDAIRSGKPEHHLLHADWRRDHPGGGLALVVPIRHSENSVGAVELLLPAETSDEDRTHCTQFVEEMSAYAARYLGWRQEALSPAEQLKFWTQFESSQLELHQSLDSAYVATAAVNDARLLLDCDRVSLALRRGPRAEIVAVSGQEQISRRSGAVRRLARIAGESMSAGRPISWQGSQKDCPPSLEQHLLEYLSESGSRAIKVIPLERALPTGTGSARKMRRRTKPSAALVLEQFSESTLTPLASARADLYARHIAAALHNARTHERVFLLGLRRIAGRCFGWLEGRTLMAAVLIVAALASAGASLCFIPAEYRVEGSGRLMPCRQRDVFAPWDGEVAELFVASGQNVEHNQPLLRLRNDELSAQALSLRNQLEAKQRQITALRAGFDGSPSTTPRTELIQIQGRITQTEVEIEGLRNRLATTEAQVNSLTLRAPIAGTVATFQIDQLLQDRPVQRGERLLEIMDEAGPWQLELDVAENRVGHLLDGRANFDRTDADVEFILATRPEEKHRGRLRKIAEQTGLSSELGTVVPVVVDVDREDIPDRRIGAEIRAKIDCGQQSAAYVLFGDVVEFIQRHVW